MNRYPDLPDLRFTYNWNNKLDCRAFSTIRIPNPKYKIGKLYRIVWDHGQPDKKTDWEKGIGEIVLIKRFQLWQLDEEDAWLDTGYSLAETTEILKRMYKNYLEEQGMKSWFQKMVVHKRKDLVEEVATKAKQEIFTQKITRTALPGPVPPPTLF